MGPSTLTLWSLLLFGTVLPVLSGEHSLFYIYTALSKPLHLPGIYDFTAMGMLNDRELDYYNSKDQMKVPMQTWMKEKMQEDYWDKGTQSRRSKEQWFKVNVEILMDRMRHNTSDLHVLQWRHGCKIDENSDGVVTFKEGIDEYSYDGSEFLSFDDQNSRWIAPVQAAEPTKRKWDGVDILNQYTKSYLEKECVKWLTEFMNYGEESLRNHSSPEVHTFQKKSLLDKGKVTLTCVATGFYPPDVEVRVRKCGTFLPEHLVTSSGNRPNNDGTYQRRVSVEVEEQEEIKSYDCYVSHITLKESVIKSFSTGSSDSPQIAIIAAVIALVLLVGAVAGGIFIAIKRRKQNVVANFQQNMENGIPENVEANFQQNMENCIPEGSGASNKENADGSPEDLRDNRQQRTNETTPFLNHEEKDDGDTESANDSGHGSKSSQESINAADKLTPSGNGITEGSGASNQKNTDGSPDDLRENSQQRTNETTPLLDTEETGDGDTESANESGHGSNSSQESIDVAGKLTPSAAGVKKL